MEFAKTERCSLGREYLGSNSWRRLFLKAWRICNKNYASDAFSGEGAFEFDDALIADAGTLPPDWDAFPAPFSTAAIGDQWIASIPDNCGFKAVDVAGRKLRAS